MLTVAGKIQSTTGGIVFPDGTTQTSAAVTAGTNNTMLSGWPDAISCNYNGATEFAYLLGHVNSGTNVQYYVAGSYINYTLAGAYANNSGWSIWDCVTGAYSISQLAARGQTFNFAKGPAAQWLQNGTSGYYNAGNVGIGTTTPSAPLWVNGSGTGASSANTAAFSAPNIGSNTSVVHWGSTGDIYWRSAASTGRVILQDTGGNVGIGTANPTAALEVKGSINLDVANSSVSPAVISPIDSGSYGVHLAFSPRANGGSAVEAMRITQAGNVGIGTTAPGAKLQVDTASIGYGEVRIKSTGTSSTIGYYSADGGWDAGVGGWNNPDKFVIGKYNPGGGAKLVVDTSGNVGIGTTNPNAKLAIANNVSSDGPGGSYSSYQLMLYDSGNANSSYGLGISSSVLWFNSAAFFKFYANGTQIGWIDASGFRTGSDLRLKKDIRVLESPLQRLLLLDGVSYSWINENFPRKRVMGFIAQDLVKVFPEVVDADENGYLSVNYSQLIAPMVEALKEEHEQKQELENKVEKLQHKLDDLIKTLCEKARTEELCHK